MTIAGQRCATAATLLGAWLLVQVPQKDMKLSEPGQPMAPITQYKTLREFDQYEQCEFARSNAMQDAMSEGSQAMAAQASSLRCVQAKDLPPAGVTPASPTKP